MVLITYIIFDRIFLRVTIQCINSYIVAWMLDQMGFPAIWRHWIMQCVSTISYAIIVNGERTEVFKPKCGLRQGDPMFPYLFILVMDLISRMMMKGERDGLFQGIKIARSAPSISHLFFCRRFSFLFQRNSLII